MILFNGNAINMDDLADDIEVKWNDLSARAQKAIFDKDHDAVITEVFASRWIEVREYAKEHIGEFSVAAMNQYIAECMDQNFDSHGVVAEFINVLGNRIDSNLYLKLVRSNSYRIKLALAKNYNTPNEILNILMQNEVKNDFLFGDNKIAAAIRVNPNYTMTESTVEYANTFRPEIQTEVQTRMQKSDYIAFIYDHVANGAAIE